MMEERPKITVIVGPTAAGKTALAVRLARRFSGEIISADSMQVYRGMDIGTAKPTAEELAAAPHHLIDVADPHEEYTAARFRDEAGAKIEEITGRGAHPFVVGGTGLYVRALTEGLMECPEADQALRDELLMLARVKGREHLHARLAEVDPESAAAIHPNNLKRVVRALEVFEISRRPISELHREHAFGERPYMALKIGVTRDRDRLYRDIETRVDGMMEAGLVDEVRGLIEGGCSTDLKPMRGLGYKEISGYVEGFYPLEEAVRLLKRNTRHYAKRQLTWFRKDKEIRWFQPEDTEGIATLVASHISS